MKTLKTSIICNGSKHDEMLRNKSKELCYYLCREIYEVLDCMKIELLRIIKKNKITLLGFSIQMSNSLMWFI